MEHKITPHFRWVKCACPCCKEIKIIPALFRHMELLEKMRERLGFAIHINSGHRCSKHNTAIGGAKASQHLKFATDVRPSYGNGFKQKLLAMHKMAKELGFTCIIHYDSFIHIDTRKKKYFADKRNNT